MKKNFFPVLIIFLSLIIAGCNINYTPGDNLLDAQFKASELDGCITPGSVENNRPPAPPLSALDVYAVISTNHSTYEYIGINQFATSYDHGGAEMYIVTREIGYGSNPYATLNGARLTELQNQRIVSGTTIIGYYRWWNANGYQNGQFVYQNTSINSPWNTMSDWINIQ